MSMLTIDLDDPDDIARAYQVLELCGGTAPASASTPASSGSDDSPWDAPDESESAQGVDPWASGGTASSKPAASRPATAKASSGGGDGLPTTGSHSVESPNGHQEWVFGLDDAPVCGCGLSGVKVYGWKGKSEAKGKPSWTAWRCARGFSKATYKGKCDLNQWA